MSAPGRARTGDQRIKSPELYQLSYRGENRLPGEFAGKVATPAVHGADCRGRAMSGDEERVVIDADYVRGLAGALLGAVLFLVVVALLAVVL